jgi:hypothetical protein
LIQPIGGAPKVAVAVDSSVDIRANGTKRAVPIWKMAGSKLDTWPLAMQKAQLL